MNVIYKRSQSIFENVKNLNSSDWTKLLLIYSLLKSQSTIIIIIVFDIAKLASESRSQLISDAIGKYFFEWN